jgi:NADPH2:quinone reductase
MDCRQMVNDTVSYSCDERSGMQAIQVREHGGPEVLELVELPEPAVPSDGLLVAVTVAGVNFVDVYQRTGQALYAVEPPYVPGGEGAGRVVAAGPDVSEFHPGDRVVWKHAPGSQAELVAVAAAEALPIPDEVSDELAAAVIVQGLTAHYLVEDVNPISAGDVAVVHSAAGGVALVLTQLIAQRGGRIVGTVSSAAKKRIAHEAGAEVVVSYDELGGAVDELTGGQGADVVFDAVGVATFDASLAALRPRGQLVVYGASSGPVPPFDIMRLNRAGSVTLSRPSLVDFTRTRAELVDRADAVLGAVAAGALAVHIGGRYRLLDASQAYTELEARRTTGKLVLLVDR